ncbi:hypothetical protein MTR67_018728 [Solanum verrucosum]|uniref:Uncharacterized protein n=1 Tax=Solanum verrucosum TaxID=315347 RepID=A0AAF0TU09_SOLVR|nr:hypothetical protein MTR67_018728 [Solanum verrucosum]
MQRIFPNDDNRSRILLTTQLLQVADYVSCPDFPPHRNTFISLDDNLNLTKKSFKKIFVSFFNCRTREAYCTTMSRITSLDCCRCWTSWSNGPNT